MSYATNVGKAIALQTPDRGDYWLRQAAQDLKLQKQAEAKAKAEQADKLATIYDIDLKGGYLPAWSKAVRSEYAKFVNQVADLRAQDPNVSYAQLIMLKNDTKARIADLKEQNDTVVSYISNENLAKDKNWVNAAQTSDDFYEIAKYNNPTYYNVVPETGYAFLNPVKVVAKDIKYPEAKGEKYLSTIARGGRKYNVYEMVFPDNIQETISVDLKNDPEYYDYTMWELSQDPVNRKSPNESLQDWYARLGDLTNAEIDRRVALARPKPFEKEEILSEAGGGGGKKLYDAEMTTNETLFGPVVGGGGRKADVPIAAKPVKVTNAINLTSNGQFRLVDNFGEAIPREYKGKTLSFNFKPNKVVSINVNGVKKLYAQGSILAPDSEQATDFVSILNKGLPPDQQIKVTEKTKWASAQNILVPYTGSVKSLIKAENNTQSIEDYDIVGETERVFKSQKGGSAYSPSQEQGIKNVMERNGISRDAAISALKAAGKL